jgi:hypothetical protein
LPTEIDAKATSCTLQQRERAAVVLVKADCK